MGRQLVECDHSEMPTGFGSGVNYAGKRPDTMRRGLIPVASTAQAQASSRVPAPTKGSVFSWPRLLSGDPSNPWSGVQWTSTGTGQEMSSYGCRCEPGC